MSTAARVGVVLGAALVGVLLGAQVVPRVVGRHEQRTGELDALWGFCLDIKVLPEQAEHFVENRWAYGQTDGTPISDVLLQPAFDLCAPQHVDLEPVMRCQRARDVRCLHDAMAHIDPQLPDHVVRKPRHEDEP